MVEQTGHAKIESTSRNPNLVKLDPKLIPVISDILNGDKSHLNDVVRVLVEGVPGQVPENLKLLPDSYSTTPYYSGKITFGELAKLTEDTGVTSIYVTN